MPWQVSGMYPTEFDPTTNLVLRTLQAVGVTEKEVEDDQNFLVDLMHSVGNIDMSQSEVIEAMDVAFIGLLVHRHLPYYDEDTGTMMRPTIGPAEYTLTMNVLANMLMEMGIPQDIVERTANEGTRRAMTALRPPESFKDEALVLHVHATALFVIGILVHRLMPTTYEMPHGIDETGQ